MQQEEIYNRLNEVFQQVFDDEALCISSSTAANDIEDWDSLAQITLTLAIEEEFEIRFELAEITGFLNVGEMVDSILKKTTQ